MRNLNVYLYEQHVGILTQDDVGQLLFAYDDRYLAKQNCLPLSQSLPLDKQNFTDKECRGFFAGILPEMQQRKIIAKNLGISARNDFSMLEAIGGECAGAISFLSANSTPNNLNEVHPMVHPKI